MLVRFPCAVVAAAAALAIAAGCAMDATPDTEPGVSRALAGNRADHLSNIRYDLAFNVPASPDERVRGRATLRFELDRVPRHLVLDFDGGEQDLLGVRIGDAGVPYRVENGHIVLARRYLRRGENEITFDFLAADAPLNRSGSFMYTLLVPARASEVFPSFDQPDLKARFTLELTVPEGWSAVTNSLELARRHVDGGVVHSFAETEPIPTYLFAFAAGEFEVVEERRAGRTMRMYHRETDEARVARNAGAVFDLHEVALLWLEDYTGILYPFEKFDFVLLPSFQYGGMEHPGAIFYRAESLLLEESPTQGQELARASLIAHETAHMWFGNLVTMTWFDDVWMKEVFANFMAAKIVNPAYPELDHDLRFLLRHHSAAYRIDRTAGANAIRQRLDNLKDAALLYGPIIYQKAPVMMRQLERIMGEDAFRDGLREYLLAHQYDNATWPDLIEILDRRSESDLAAWSAVWVEAPGRPTVRARIEPSGASVGELVLEQEDPHGQGRIWGQWLDVALGHEASTQLVPVLVDAPAVTANGAAGAPLPRFVLPDGDGFGYARFQLDERSRTWLLANLAAVREPRVRAVAWLALWDALLESEIGTGAFMDLALRALAGVTEEQTADRMARDVATAFWTMLRPEERARVAPDLEAVLWQRLTDSRLPRERRMYFEAYRSLALSDRAVNRLDSIWRDDEAVPGLVLGDDDMASLALELAVRRPETARAVLEAQLQRFENPDRRERFAFVMPAASPDPATRAAFFESLADAANRRREPWVLEGLSYLHHPLRARESLAYVRPALELLREVHETGDIFFPARWLEATLSGHASPEAADVIRSFLDERDGYPERLRGKILQAADLLFRASAVHRDRLAD